MILSSTYFSRKNNYKQLLITLNQVVKNQTNHIFNKSNEFYKMLEVLRNIFGSVYNNDLRTSERRKSIKTGH